MSRDCERQCRTCRRSLINVVWLRTTALQRGHSLGGAGLMHCRQRSTTAAVCPCSCTRSDRLAPGPPASQPALAGRLGLVLPPSSRVLSPWPRALAKKTRHLQHSACGNQSPRFSDRRDLRSRPRACRFQHAVTTSSAEKNVPSTSWLAAFGSSSGTVDVTVLAVTDRVGTPS